MFVPGQFLPAILVGWGIDREQAFTEALSRTSPAATAATIVDRTVLTTGSNDVVLDGCQILNKEVSADKTKARVIVWLNANGVIFEQNVLFAREYAHRLKAHAVLFNYRGVGASTGWPYVSADLGEDGVTAVKYAIKTFGVQEHNVIIHGHSIGGGVMSMVVGEFPKATIINDRSFWDLGAEASILIQLTGLCKFMGGLFGAYVMIVGWIVKSSMAEGASVDMSSYPGFSTSMMAGSILGWYALGKSGAIVAITPNILGYMGWLMESGKTWDNSRGLIIYHKGDGMIPYEGASLHNYMQNSDGGAINSFELTVARDPQFNHMAPLNAVPDQWERVLAAIEDLLQRGRKLGHE